MTESALEGPTPTTDLLQERFPGLLIGASFFRGEETVEIHAADVPKLCRVLHDDPAFRFDFLTDLCGVHFPDRPLPYAVVYHLYCFSGKRRLRLKAWAGEGESVPSVTGIWSGANWHEREAFDLVGIRFEGHPDLRRILMPEDFDGFPLRKDFPVEG